LTAPGGQLPARCCDTLLNREKWPAFPTGETTKQDLFLLLPIDAHQSITDLSITIAGQNGLDARADASALSQVLQHLETRAYASDTGPAAADGRHVQTGWVARLPVLLTPTNPWDVGGVRYPLDLTATYRVAGDDQPHALSMRAAIAAQIPNALEEMSAVALLLPLLCFLAALARWRRTR